MNRKIYGKLLSSLFAMGVFLFVTQLSAQSTTAAIMIRKPGSKTSVPLKLHELKIRVKVMGSLAETTMEMTYYNGMNRVLEGDFYLPLGAGQTVSAYALEVNGNLREGVVVEREQGRVAFETTVRKMIDPGLLEWTKGNNFKSRIYPIPAKGYKRLVITFEQELKSTGQGFLYNLPLNFPGKVAKFSLETEVFKQEVTPKLPPENELVNFRFKKWQESYIARVKHANYRPTRKLAFLLPRTKAYKKMLTEVDSASGKNYFYLHMFPQARRVAKKMPGTINLYWDASGSAVNRNVKRELALLDRYFKKVGKARVRLILFRNETAGAEMYRIRRGGWDRLKKRLSNVKYDGGTSLGGLDFKDCRCDEIILSTDGVSNFGESEIRTGKTPVIVLNSSATAGHSYLEYIARTTGGTYLDLNRLRDNEAFQGISNVTFQFMGAEFEKGALAEVYPKPGTPVRGALAVSGIIKKKRVRIKLRFGAGGRVLDTREFIITSRKGGNTRGMVKRIWAQKKIAELDMLPEKNRRELIDMGKSFSIVTRFTSLIVLDRVQDYARHKIEPPKELRKEYYAILQKEENKKRKAKESRLEKIVLKYQNMQKWWNKKFSMEDRPKPKPINKKTSESRERPRPARDPARRPARNGGASTGVTADEDNRRLSKKKKKKPGSSTGAIVMKKWDPKTPYIKKLKSVDEIHLYDEYLKLKKKHASSAFYLDVSDYFRKRKKPRLALRVLSNIAEMELQNHQLLRILAHRLTQIEELELAGTTFVEVLKMRAEEPQSYRDLALVYARSGKSQKAVDLLHKVVLGKWSRRFPDIQLIALHEMNAVIGRNSKVDTGNIDKRLLKNMPVDVRVVLNWDADLTDMDLWVTDPNAEKCYYSHKRTFLGGLMSQDFTGGYGPEVYLLRRAKDGKYRIQINYYGNRQQMLAGATTVQVQLFLNYGKKNQTMKEITLRLKDKKEVIDVGEFMFK